MEFVRELSRVGVIGEGSTFKFCCDKGESTAVGLVNEPRMSVNLALNMVETGRRDRPSKLIWEGGADAGGLPPYKLLGLEELGASIVKRPDGVLEFKYCDEGRSDGFESDCDKSVDSCPSEFT